MASAQVFVVTRPNGSNPDYIWELGLDGAGGDTIGNEAVRDSGSFTGGSPNDSIVVTVTAVNDWNSTNAQTNITNNTFATYRSGLTAEDLDALNSGSFGVVGGSTDTDTFNAGEAAIFTFGSYSLNPNTRVSLEWP